MELEQWLPLYHEICGDFGYDEEADARSADALSSLLASMDVPALEWLKSSCPETVTVCGDAPSLREAVRRRPPRGYTVAADRATSVLMDEGLRPDAIVTDLDGAIEDQLRANAQGSIVYVHAHGDNTDAVKRFVPSFRGKVVGTCQGPPSGRLVNMGGFTDGDRAVCIFAALGAKRIVLEGFDFENPSPKPSRAPDVKARKLLWARKIIRIVSEQGVEIEGV